MALVDPTPDPSGRLAFIPLEGNPELMTRLLHRLGLSEEMEMHDVFSITEPDLLAMIPRPAPAVLLVFPVSPVYESHRLAEDSLLTEYKGKGKDEPVLWFRQTIRNACGLMALLHAVANGIARQNIKEGSDLAKLIDDATPLLPAERSLLLEKAGSLATAHREAASQGSTAAPEATDSVDLHYVCFVKGSDGNLWELDGSRKGPLNRGQLAENEDALSERALALGPLKFLEREPEDPRFSCLALGPKAQQ